jgi:hypothetical protein
MNGLTGIPIITSFSIPRRKQVNKDSFCRWHLAKLSLWSHIPSMSLIVCCTDRLLGTPPSSSSSLCRHIHCTKRKISAKSLWDLTSCQRSESISFLVSIMSTMAEPMYNPQYQPGMTTAPLPLSAMSGMILPPQQQQQYQSVPTPTNPVVVDAWQQQQQFLQWQQFQQWQQMQQQQQQQLTTPFSFQQSVPLPTTTTAATTTAAASPATAPMPAFGSALSQPVPQPQQQTSPLPTASTKESTTTNATTTATTAATTGATNTMPGSGTNTNAGTGTSSSSSSTGGGGFLDGIINMINSMNTGVSSVNSNSATLLKSIASSLTQLKQFMTLFKTCGSS